MAKSQPSFPQPHWWTDVHNRAWDHAREAFRARWEQQEPAEPSAKAGEWDEVEPAIRFGFGRRRLPPVAEPEVKPTEPPDWDPELEAKLEQEWDSMHNVSEESAAPRLWNDVRQFVHRGWFGP